MQLARFILLISFFFLSGFCNAPKNKHERHPYILGTTKINTQRIYFPGEDSVQLVLLHHNENTARNVAVDVLKNTGGFLLTIENGGERLIKFKHKKKMFSFDPNRIFTPQGRRQTLYRNGLHTPGSENLLAGFAAHLLKLIDTSIVISMHNNTDGAYSVKSYDAGGVYSKDAALMHINPSLDADNFFLTTDSSIYEHIKTLDYNVVLQHNQHAVDDGSLSVYCGKAGLPYINIEAQHGHAQEQAEMLQAILSILRR